MTSLFPLYDLLMSSLFPCGLFRKLPGDQIFIGNAGLQLPRLVKNILQEIKAAFLKDGVILPGILIFITRHDRGNVRLVCLGKLRLDGFCDLFCAVAVDVLKAALNGTERRMLIG